MSNPNDPNLNPVPSAEEETPVVEKQSFAAKAKTFVKTHKKPVIATGALVGLVVVSALAGRKTAPDAEVLILELEPAEETLEDVEETDTTVA